MDYSIVSQDEGICEYIEKMTDWFTVNTILSIDKTYLVILGEKDRINVLFEPDPLTILSEDP